jgi:hypothetical protein
LDDIVQLDFEIDCKRLVSHPVYSDHLRSLSGLSTNVGTYAENTSPFETTRGEVFEDKKLNDVLEELSIHVRITTSDNKDERGGHPINCAPHFLALLLERMHPRDFAALLAACKPARIALDNYGIMAMDVKARATREMELDGDLFWPVIYPWPNTGNYYESGRGAQTVSTTFGWCNERGERCLKTVKHDLRGTKVDRSDAIPAFDWRNESILGGEAYERHFSEEEITVAQARRKKAFTSLCALRIVVDDVGGGVRCRLRAKEWLDKNERPEIDTPGPKDAGFGVMMHAKCMAVACCAVHNKRRYRGSGFSCSIPSTSVLTDVTKFNMYEAIEFSFLALENHHYVDKLSVACKMVAAAHMLHLHAPAVFCDDNVSLDTLDEDQSNKRRPPCNVRDTDYAYEAKDEDECSNFVDFTISPGTGFPNAYNLNRRVGFAFLGEDLLQQISVQPRTPEISFTPCLK